MSNYFRFGQTTVRHIGILLPVLILTVSPYSACHCALGCQISSKSVHPQRYVISMAAAAAQFYFWLRISWRHCLQNVRICQQTKFLSYNSIHSWDRTISGVEKQTSAILEFYFRFRFRSYHRSRYVILHQCEISSKSDRPGQKNDVMSIFKIADLCHLGFFYCNIPLPNNENFSIRPLSRRIPPPQPAGTLPRRRRRKKFGAPPRQPKFTDAAAAAIFKWF